MGEIPHKAKTFPMEIRKVFAQNLRRCRKAKGLSQEALAYDADIDRTYISALERGVYAATIDMVAGSPRYWASNQRSYCATTDHRAARNPRCTRDLPPVPRPVCGGLLSSAK